MTISILNDFSEYPGLRHCTISEKSGEEFYHLILNTAFYKAFIENKELIVDLDNTGGFASSFLDEAFGNLVYDFTLNEVKKRIQIISTQEPHWKSMLEEKSYLQWENRRKDKIKPKVTISHKPWYRLINNEPVLKVWEQPVSA